jgi:eukaryotic-like serine/threonine-protein kinase
MFGRLKGWLRRHQKGTLERFIDLLGKSQLCTEQQIGQLVSSFERERGDIASGDVVAQFCDFLVGTDAVTAWQCDKLKAGKFKGFYLDNYVLLEHSGKGADYSSYKSRDTKNGNIVNLVIRPRPVNQTGGQIEYRVEPWVKP